MIDKAKDKNEVGADSEVRLDIKTCPAGQIIGKTNILLR